MRGTRAQIPRIRPRRSRRRQKVLASVSLVIERGARRFASYPARPHYSSLDSRFSSFISFSRVAGNCKSVIIDVFTCKFRFFCRTDYEETIHRYSFSETIGLALRVRTSLHSQRCGCVRLGGGEGGEGRREKMSRGEERGTSGSDVPGTRTTARERRREGGEERERVRTGASAIRAVIRQRRDE